MALELLIQEAEGMSEAALLQVLRFMRFIKAEPAQQSAEERAGQEENRPVIRRAGIYRGQIRMAEDFDAPLEEFEEYM